MNKIQQNIQELRDNYKGSNINVIRTQEERQRNRRKN